MKTRLCVWFAVALSGGTATLLGGCPYFAPDVGPFPDGGGIDGGSDSEVDGSPPVCDPAKDPSCVSDASGIFVSPAGVDSNAGTKESPVKTIVAALTKASSSKPNVYICAGTYPEHVKVTSALNLVGGFSCGDWSYAATNKPKVAPSDAGYALDVESVATAITVSDLEFDAQPGAKPGESSIAVFVASSNVTLKRVTATAGDGVAGSDPVNADVDGGAPPTPAAATNESGAAGCTQTCNGVVTSGGAGGNGAVTFGGVSGGADGGPAIPAKPAGFDGVGGPPKMGGCNSGNNGANANDVDAGTAGASKAGTLSAAGWSNETGAAGASGSVGQGGGGGSGGVSAAVGGGGGGGCGGCGGAGGAGGASGGSSFAVLSFESTLTLDVCTLTAGKGGDGKAGGKGQSGQTGGGAGAPASLGIGCPGGTGGNGGAGAGGGGGAGGNAIAVGYVGTKPAATSCTYAEGASGQAGPGGAGGAGNDGAFGAAGIKADVEELH